MSLRGALDFAEAVPQRRELASSGPRKTSGQASKSLLATTCLSSYVPSAVALLTGVTICQQAAVQLPPYLR